MGNKWPMTDPPGLPSPSTSCPLTTTSFIDGGIVHCLRGWSQKGSCPGCIFLVHWRGLTGAPYVQPVAANADTVFLDTMAVNKYYIRDSRKKTVELCAHANIEAAHNVGKRCMEKLLKFHFINVTCSPPGPSSGLPFLPFLSSSLYTSILFPSDASLSLDTT